MALKNIIPEGFKEAAEKAAFKNGCRSAGISFVRERKQKILRVEIDGPDTSLDVCAAVSREISRWLDERENLIPGPYSLEVTSPGADRPLKTPEDFEKHKGGLVYIETKTKAPDGRKRYKGRIKAVEGGAVSLYVEKERAGFNIPLNDISKARREYEFLEEQ